MADRARTEHDAFVAQLRGRGVVVHYFHDLLTEALDQPGAREFLQERLTTATRFGPGLDKPLGLLVGRHPRVYWPSCLWGGLKRDHNSAWTYNCVSINPMAKQARKRETINSRLVYNFHPKFRDADIDSIYGTDSLVHDPATVEGGDVLVIGNGSVMIGMGERTAPQGVETLARLLFRRRQVDRVIVVELPKVRAFMHLDTALTMVDRDAFSVYPYLPEALRSFTLVPSETVVTRAGQGWTPVHDLPDRAELLSWRLAAISGRRGPG